MREEGRERDEDIKRGNINAGNHLPPDNYERTSIGQTDWPLYFHCRQRFSPLDRLPSLSDPARLTTTRAINIIERQQGLKIAVRRSSSGLSTFLSFSLIPTLPCAFISLQSRIYFGFEKFLLLSRSCFRSICNGEGRNADRRRKLYIARVARREREGERGREREKERASFRSFGRSVDSVFTSRTRDGRAGWLAGYTLYSLYANASLATTQGVPAANKTLNATSLFVKPV